MDRAALQTDGGSTARQPCLWEKRASSSASAAPHPSVGEGALLSGQSPAVYSADSIIRSFYLAAAGSMPPGGGAALSWCDPEKGLVCGSHTNLRLNWRQRRGRGKVHSLLNLTNFKQNILPCEEKLSSTDTYCLKFWGQMCAKNLKLKHLHLLPQEFCFSHFVHFAKSIIYK